MEPKLYIIATPLGNLEDITRRAVKVFEAVRVFFAEDTRELKKLFNLLHISLEGKEIHAYQDRSKNRAIPMAIQRLTEGQSVGLICDRGTPTISDPGAFLVREVRKKGFGVEPIPGPSSVTAALSVSGISANRFICLGFLPTETQERKLLLERVYCLQFPFVFFESPRRIRETLRRIQNDCPNAKVFIAREMTKQFETYMLKALRDLDENDLPELGEYVVVVEQEASVTRSDWQPELERRIASDKEWSKQLAKTYRVASSEIYNALQRLRREAKNSPS